MDNKLQDRVDELERRLSETASPDVSVQNKMLKMLPFITAGHVLFSAPALIASLALAYFAFVQADATRKMQVGGAMPFVSYGTSNVSEEGNEEIRLSLANNGIGPAILGPIEVRYRGETMQDAARLLTECCGFETGGDVSFMTSPASDVAIRPGESVSFLRIQRTERNNAIWEKLNKERWNFEVRSCYCSIYKDCWTIEGAQAIPTETSQCPANWESFGKQQPS